MATINVTKTEVSQDTTPQLGGPLDVNGQKITSAGGANIDIEPNGTGNVLIGNFTFDADQSVGAGQDNYVLTYDNGGGIISLEAAGGGGVLNATLSDTQTFTSSGTWTKPGAGDFAIVFCWGAGGSGAKSGSNTNGSGGAGGGAFTCKGFLLSALGATETVTVGAGGASRTGSSDGLAGGNSDFGTLVYAYGGGGGADNGTSACGGGGGGGAGAAGTTATGSSGGAGGSAGSSLPGPVSYSMIGQLFGYSGSTGASSGSSDARTVDGRLGGGAGGGRGDYDGSGRSSGGDAEWGGGGGGGQDGTGAATGGTSWIGGGHGGDAGVNITAGDAGTQPSGGGGASETGNSGAGGDGKIVVYTFTIN